MKLRQLQHCPVRRLLATAAQTQPNRDSRMGYRDYRVLTLSAGIAGRAWHSCDDVGRVELTGYGLVV